MDRRPLGSSLRATLVRLLALVILLAAAAQAGLVYRLTRAQADALFDRQMRQLAEALEGAADLAPAPAGLEASTGDRHAGFAIQIWSADGVCLFQSPQGAALPATPAPGFLTAAVGGSQYRVFSARTRDRVIKVAQDLDAREDMATGLALRAVLPTLLLAPVLVGLVWLVVRRATRPMLRVRDQVSRRAADDLSMLPVVDLPAEVRPLVEEINRQFARLVTVFAAQRDFVADAAHELRTPLAALRLQVQGLRRADGEAARIQAERRALEGVDRASRLVEQLLVLARQEAGAEPGDPGADLGGVVAQVLAEVLPVAQARRIDLGMLPGEQAGVLCPVEPLAILVRNLLENAVKFTPEGGTIDLAVRLQAGRAVLTVADSGPGIPPEQRGRVFERFHRLPGEAVAGSGLGLAIVKAIADRHRGAVSLSRSERLGGLEVAVALPVAPWVSLRA